MQDVAARLQAWGESARRKWQGVMVPDAAFLAHLAARLPLAELSASQAASIHTDDLYLACACAAGDRQAVLAFERAFGSQIDAALSRIRFAPGLLDDIKQMIREKLLVVRSDRPAKIAEYSGKGSLASWVQTVATRTALDVVRSTQAVVPEGHVAPALNLSERDPELAFVRSRYLSAFESAVREAVEALPPRDKLLLVQYYVDGLDTRELARLHQIHAVTAVRRLAKVRSSVRSNAKKLLSQRIRLTPSELRSIVRLVKSDMDISICRVLAEGVPPTVPPPRAP